MGSCVEPDLGHAPTSLWKEREKAGLDKRVGDTTRGLICLQALYDSDGLSTRSYESIWYDMRVTDSGSVAPLRGPLAASDSRLATRHSLSSPPCLALPTRCSLLPPPFHAPAHRPIRARPRPLSYPPPSLPPPLACAFFTLLPTHSSTRIPLSITEHTVSKPRTCK